MEEGDEKSLDIEIKRIDVLENQKVPKGIACIEIKVGESIWTILLGSW